MKLRAIIHQGHDLTHLVPKVTVLRPAKSARLQANLVADLQCASAGVLRVHWRYQGAPLA